MEQASICWLALLVVLIIIELATMGLTTIWFAGGSVAAFIASILDMHIVAQLVLFLVVSILLLVFTRPFAARYINKHKTQTNIDALIGAKAVVTQDIDNLLATGEAKLAGNEWMARSEDDNVRIEAGITVVVVEISGAKLIVKREEEEIAV